MEVWTDRDYAQAALDMLPGSVEEIAVLLRAHGIKGEAGRAFSCPIARWVQKWTGNPKSATFSMCTWLNDFHDHVPNPPAVRDFIHAYDAGRISV